MTWSRIEPATSRSRIRRANHSATHIPYEILLIIFLDRRLKKIYTCYPFYGARTMIVSKQKQITDLEPVRSFPYDTEYALCETGFIVVYSNPFYKPSLASSENQSDVVVFNKTGR
ncbi:hypothetical protein ElyMa_001720900 [Elysia marginata]|uniref:Uncharacterized protein n=1 Tax=Elysia marginata TaxID=1093978 RepID=A0AAV4JW71_9GAST|nr:hypothetical protein ElyMa_001720900 [Elysia marginata]